jgi:hypothetical protein
MVEHHINKEICTVSVVFPLFCAPAVHIFIFFLTPFFQSHIMFIRHSRNLAKLKIEDRTSALSLIKLELNTYTLVCLPAVLCV